MHSFPAVSKDDAPQTQAAVVRKWFESNLPVFSPYREAVANEDRFRDGERYPEDSGPANLQIQLTQIRGEEVHDTIRHMAAEATAKPRSVEARPIDSEDDADHAEVEVALVDNLLRDPWKGFESRRYEAIFEALARRTGIVWMDWNPGVGPYGGEISFRTVDFRRCMWTPGYDPHDPNCDVFLEQRRVDVEQAKRDYPNAAEWLQPDHMALDASRSNLRDGVPIIRDGSHSLMPTSYDDGKVELWFFWNKNDRTYIQREAGPEGDQDIAEEDRYLACTKKCGYRSPTQGSLKQKLPAELDFCPSCAANGRDGTLERVDSFAGNESVRAYTKGHRLTIISPFCKGPEDEPIYDGGWPIKNARSFPGFFPQAELDPRKPTGKSVVVRMWDQQIASDNMATMALQRVYEHRSFWELPKNVYTDFEGNRFNFLPHQRNVMFRDNSQTFTSPVQVHSGESLDQMWPIVNSVLQEKLVRYRPVADFGLTEDSSKNIPVGTVQAIQKQANVPIAEFIRRVNMELSKFYGVVSDYIHATYTPQRLSRLNIDGIDLVAGIWGPDMPNFDFVVEEAPDFTGLEKAKSEAFNALMQVIPQAAQLGLPVDVVLELFSEMNNLPRSVVRKFQKGIKQAQDEAQAAAQEQAAAQQQMSGGTQDAGPGMDAAADPMQQLMNGLNASGHGVSQAAA